MGFFKRNKNKDLNHDPHNILSNEALSKVSSDFSPNVLILNEPGAHGKFTSREKEPSMKVKLSKHCCGTKNLTFAYGFAGTGKTERFVKPNLLNDDANYIVFTKRPNELSNVIKRMKKNGYKIDCLDHSLPMGKQYNPFDNICTAMDARMFCESITRALNDKYYSRAISPFDLLHDYYDASFPRDPFYDYAEANLRDAVLMYVFLELKTYSFLEASQLLQSKTDQELLELFELSQNIGSNVIENFKKYLLAPDKTRTAVRNKVNIDFIQLDSTYNNAPGVGSNTIDLTKMFEEKHAIFIGSFSKNSKIMDRMFMDRIIDFARIYCFQNPKRPLHIIIDDALSFEYNSRFKEFVSYAIDKKIYVSITMCTMDDTNFLTGTAFCGFSDCNAVQLSATETCTVLSNGDFRTDEKLDSVK